MTYSVRCFQVWKPAEPKNSAQTLAQGSGEGVPTNKGKRTPRLQNHLPLVTHNTDGNKESCLSRERVKILERCLCPTDKPRPLLL